MSLGIVYRARLPRPERLPDLVEFARARAELRGWRSAEAEPQFLTEAIVRAPDGGGEPRHGVRIRGAWLNPHFGADDLCLVFDEDTGELLDPSRGGSSPTPVLQGFAVTRTTWADAPTHAALVGLLEDLAAEDLASVEIGDAAGKTLARELPDIEERLARARKQAFAGTLARPTEPTRLGGVLDLLAPDESRRHREAATGALDLLAPAERELLERSRERLVHRWVGTAPGLDAQPGFALPALEHLTDLLLSHPDYRHEPEYLERDYSWDSGALLGFLLIEALGGHWERVEGQKGPILRVANLGGVGLVWRPFWSADQRLHEGTLFAHDAVLGWLAAMVLPAREAGLG